MANRSYLYSTNILPGPNAKANGQRLVGVSEWNNDIPLVFKLLVSSSTMTCPSSIWDGQGDMALAGDYAGGVKNLEGFFSKIALPSAQPLIAEALEFLNNPDHQNQYFILEGAEIFDMGNTLPQAQNRALLEQVGYLQPEIEVALQSLLQLSAPPPVPPVPPVPASFFARLVGRAPAPAKQPDDPMEPVYALGLGNWSSILYFDFSSRQHNI